MRLSLIVLFGLALTAAGCDRKPEPPAPAATTPDPSAPAPGTQAAEAIGADSDDNAAVLPPDKNPH